MAKIFIIGSSGYIGSVLHKKCTNLGHEVVGYDSLIYEQDIYPDIIGDTRNYDLLWNSILRFKPDFVFHFGDLSSTYSCEHNHTLTESVNFKGTKNVMDICHELGIDVIYNSSSSVYSGNDMYVKSKLKVEEYVKDMTNVCVFRPATLFGLSPRFRIELLPHHFTYMALKSRIVVSGGENYRAFLDVADLVDAYVKVIDRKEWNEPFYDIGHFNMTKTEVAKEIQKIVPCEIIATDTVFDTRNLQVDCSKFEDEFGWKPTKSFGQSIGEVSTWMKENLPNIESSNFSGMLNMPLIQWNKICQ